jgi:hypothetical protein
MHACKHADAGGQTSPSHARSDLYMPACQPVVDEQNSRLMTPIPKRASLVDQESSASRWTGLYLQCICSHGDGVDHARFDSI